MESPVIKNIVNNGFCVGCGSCVALCPQKALKMQWNHNGEYNPVDVTTCGKECGLCMMVCPFGDNGENEDSIGQRLYENTPKISRSAEIGYYLECMVGYSEKHRRTSASGGIVTWLMETLLSTGEVDHVICVAPNADPEKLFTFKVFDKIEDVRNGAGSAYYPVEASDVLRYVLTTPGRYAITGLPCFIKSIRLAQLKNKKISEKIIIVVGLTCGQQKDKYYTQYLAALSGISGVVHSVKFRGKSEDNPVKNYYFSCRNNNNDEKKLFQTEGAAEAWANRWFTIQSCNYCDDIFAECADITCMDAWLPEYSEDCFGTNLIIIRSQKILGIIEKGRKKGLIQVDSITPDRVIQSQAGVIKVKRNDLAIRIAIALEKGQRVPKKRVTPKKNINPLKRIEIETLYQMQIESKQQFIKGLEGETQPNAKKLRKHFRQHLKKVALIRRALRIFKAI